MIRWHSVLRATGFFILAFTGSLGLTIGASLIFGLSDASPLISAMLISACLGGILTFSFRSASGEFSHREGIVLVLITWVTFSALGALPFHFSGYFASFTDAFFESISGFTTTGATILGAAEALPRALLLWRALTQWIGGMGIILLGIAILPLIGTGGVELYRSEFSGAKSEKLAPRVAEAATALWKLYVAFSLAEYIALRLAGMNSFEAVCHTFSTMATGGFSTRNTSIEAFGSPAIEAIIIVFMLIAGVSFALHYRLIVEGRARVFFGDQELRFYCVLLAGGTLAIATALTFSSHEPVEAGRAALFQVVSIMTGTGFSSANFGSWAPFAQLLLLALMFIGGCTGSTTGGLKVARLFLLFRVVAREFRQMAERRGIFAIRLNGEVVSENTIQSLLNLVYIAFLINCVTKYIKKTS